jgi:hypothetical protein
MFSKLLTKKYRRIPLLWIDFDLIKYHLCGKDNSCTVHLHPLLKKDEILNDKIRDVINYIRDNYDMDKLV